MCRPKSAPLAQLCVLVCRVADPAHPEELQTLRRIDLPPLSLEQLQELPPGTGLEHLEAQACAVGQELTRSLLLAEWQEVDHALVADYQRLSPPRYLS